MHGRLWRYVLRFGGLRSQFEKADCKKYKNTSPHSLTKLMFTNYILPSKNCKEPIQKHGPPQRATGSGFLIRTMSTFLSGTTKLVRRFEKYNKGFVGLNVFEAHYIFS